MRARAAVVGASLVLACAPPERAATDSATDTATVTPAPGLAAAWASELGSALLVPGDSDGTAILIYPRELSASAASRMTLLTRSGDSMTVRATVAASDSLVCGEAPTLRFSDSTSGDWSVGVLGARARTVRTDSSMWSSATDSTRAVAEIARLASTLPSTSDPRFLGLPFVVTDMRRFDTDGREIQVAQLVRRIPQEATPLEERVLLVAERADGSAYTVTYHQRSTGTEETAEHYDVLAAFRGREALYLVVTRDQEARTRYEVLERAPSGGWRVRWARVLEC